MREIVHLQAGQCGNQIGAKVCIWYLILHTNTNITSYLRNENTWIGSVRVLFKLTWKKKQQIGTNMRDKFNDLIVISKSFPFKRSIFFFDSSLFWFGFWFIYEFIADVSCFRVCYFHFRVILYSQCGSIIVVCDNCTPVYTQEFVNSNK